MQVRFCHARGMGHKVTQLYCRDFFFTNVHELVALSVGPYGHQPHDPMDSARDGSVSSQQLPVSKLTIVGGRLD